MVDHIISSISNFTPIDDSELFFRESGIIPFLPDVINFISPNTTQCVCSDLQHEDYSRLYEVFNFIVIIISLPCVSVCGLASNVVNFYIYSRPSMAKSSSNTYLLALSCSDWLVVITGVFIFWIDSARSYIPALAQAPYSTVYALPFGYMAQTNSIYFTVAAAIDCYFNVCWKNKSSQYCNVKTAKRICIGITICSILYNSLRFPQFNLRLCLHEESQVNVLEICPTTLFFIVNQAYNVYMYMVLMTLLPFMFLLVLNAFIVAKQSTKKNDDQLPHNGLEKKISIPLETSKDESTGDTITLIMVVVLFLLCNFLSLFVNLIETFFEPDPLLLNLLSDASNFLVIFNSSVNSIIYVTFNEKYRQLFKELMYKMKRKIGGRCFSDEKKETKVIKDQTLYFNEVPSSCKEFTSSFKEPSEPSSPIWKPQTVQNQCYSDAHSIYDSEWHGKINDKSRFSCFNADNYELLLVDEDCESHGENISISTNLHPYNDKITCIPNGHSNKYIKNSSKLSTISQLENDTSQQQQVNIYNKIRINDICFNHYQPNNRSFITHIENKIPDSSNGSKERFNSVIQEADTNNVKQRPLGITMTSL